MAMPMHHRLLEAYFSENRTISDWTVLADLVSEIGEDSSLSQKLEEQKSDLVDQVVADHNEAVGQGDLAVPTTLINHVLRLPCRKTDIH